MTDPLALSLPALAAALRERSVSAVEVVSAAVARHQQFGDRLRAYKLWDGDRALAAAHEVDRAIAAGRPVGPLAGVPVSVNTGIPGPPMPAEPQRPLYLDEVCLFFPELVLIMAHGADPWWGEAIRLMLKYPNLYMMTSAYAPKYLPPELIQFMNTRGQGKILFASDHPVLSFERCLSEAAELPLRDGVLEKYLRGNALSVFRWD